MTKESAKQTQNYPDVSASLFSMRFFNAERDLPIVYNSNYNMKMAGLELMHRFDTKKYTKMSEYLSELFLDTPFAREKSLDDSKEQNDDNDILNKVRKLRYLTPNRPVNEVELEIHHLRDYVQQIHSDKSLVARITETWLLNLLPLSLIESRLLTPIKWQVAGTIFAFHLAMQHGWAINLGGGFHVASFKSGETFCIFSDILLAIKYIWRKHPLQKFMIIDADAHQATGTERDFSLLDAKNRKNVYIVDIFNGSIQPPDPEADKEIDLRVELGRFVGDSTYMAKLKGSLSRAFANFNPTMIVYIAGQDVLKEDQLGLMNLSDDGLKQRDELIFSAATEKHRCPIVMLLGGGYLVRGIKVQADSIRNLYSKSLIWGGHRSGSRTLTRPKNTPINNSRSKSSSSRKRLAVTKSNPDVTYVIKRATKNEGPQFKTLTKELTKKVNGANKSCKRA